MKTQCEWIRMKDTLQLTTVSGHSNSSTQRAAERISQDSRETIMCRCIASKGLNTSHIKKHTFDSPVAHTNCELRPNILTQFSGMRSVPFHEFLSSAFHKQLSSGIRVMRQTTCTALHSNAQGTLGVWAHSSLKAGKLLVVQGSQQPKPWSAAGLLDDYYRSWTGFPQKDQKASKPNTGHAQKSQSWYSKHTLLIKFQTHRETNEDHVNQFAAGPGKRASYLDYQRAEEKLVANENILGWSHVFPPEC